jgi:hypothetical protein
MIVICAYSCRHSGTVRIQFTVLTKVGSNVTDLYNALQWPYRVPCKSSQDKSDNQQGGAAGDQLHGAVPCILPARIPGTASVHSPKSATAQDVCRAWDTALAGLDGPVSMSRHGTRAASTAQIEPLSSNSCIPMLPYAPRLLQEDVCSWPSSPATDAWATLSPKPGGLPSFAWGEPLNHEARDMSDVQADLGTAGAAAGTYPSASSSGSITFDKPSTACHPGAKYTWHKSLLPAGELLGSNQLGQSGDLVPGASSAQVCTSTSSTVVPNTHAGWLVAPVDVHENMIAHTIFCNEDWNMVRGPTPCSPASERRVSACIAKGDAVSGAVDKTWVAHADYVFVQFSGYLVDESSCYPNVECFGKISGACLASDVDMDAMLVDLTG